MRTLSFLWSSVNAGMRAWKGTRGVRLPAKVISIGNIEAGGTGKTPVIRDLVRLGLQGGLQKIALLTRGYRGSLESSGALIQPGDPPANPFEVGEEVAWMQQQCPKLWIGMGKNRLASAQRLFQQVTDLDWVLLEDGFQNHVFKKDENWVTWTSRPWGTGGFFRDFPGQIPLFATAVVWTHGKNPPPPSWKLPTLSWRAAPVPAEASERGFSYVLITGIAHPERALESAAQAGFSVTQQWAFRDHACYSLSDLKELQRKAEGLGLRILLTEKDAIKWDFLKNSDPTFFSPASPWAVLRQKGAFTPESERWLKNRLGLVI